MEQRVSLIKQINKFFFILSASIPTWNICVFDSKKPIFTLFSFLLY